MKTIGPSIALCGLHPLAVGEKIYWQSDRGPNGRGSGRRPSGRLFRFQLLYGPIFYSIGCPVFRVDGVKLALRNCADNLRIVCAGNYAELPAQLHFLWRFSARLMTLYCAKNTPEILTPHCVIREKMS